MVNEKELKSMVESLLTEMMKGNVELPKENKVEKQNETSNIEDGYIEDITLVDLKEQLLVPNPEDKDGYLKMKMNTPARVGIWRAGPRYKTITSLRFRADHAAAQDSVFSDVSEEFVKEMNFIKVNTICKDKDQYITRPDFGRQFSDESKDIMRKSLNKNSKVQIVIGDGLSSAAIEANVKDILPAIIQGLKGYGIDAGPCIFVKYCRVPAMDVISEITQADVTLLLVGERPGLVTAESMSAYIAYKATVGMPEARRTVISNIHKGGTTAVEAGAHIAELVKTMIDKKASGIDLKSL
ncbi:ethanolamine ammonia-lyase subunit EutC [Clostridium gasigenes]|uniref:ethanolamine ammonia-lyase subunit EutC n=1 Tax=Clostridium gasigenes TaxID=94869 RepID=UPI001C0E0585|nr:ethanolamine ammonia-lyase subunit EutC [Clostridium gasigenes]MBU3105640.1 ethanolamine ammonia-lyase subunit EutC [Clostridium gasigenes]